MSPPPDPTAVNRLPSLPHRSQLQQQLTQQLALEKEASLLQHNRRTHAWSAVVGSSCLDRRCRRQLVRLMLAFLS